MTKNSAGLLAFRIQRRVIEVLLVHPGGPFWAKKDEGSWSIPKGEFADSEEPLAAAKREFAEETGLEPRGEFFRLGSFRQSKAKIIHVWAVAGDWDLSKFKSNTFQMEWPPKSGRQQEFPEVDRVEWFPIPEARRKLLKGQLPVLDRLAELVAKASEEDR